MAQNQATGKSYKLALPKLYLNTNFSILAAKRVKLENKPANLLEDDGKYE